MDSIQASSANLGPGVALTSGAGAENTPLSLSLTAGTSQKLQICSIMVAWNGEVAAVSHTVTLDSVLGATYDCLLGSESLTGQYLVWYPDFDLILFPGDKLTVAVAEGGAEKSATAVITYKQ